MAQIIIPDLFGGFQAFLNSPLQQHKEFMSNWAWCNRSLDIFIANLSLDCCCTGCTTENEVQSLYLWIGLTRCLWVKTGEGSTFVTPTLWPNGGGQDFGGVVWSLLHGNKQWQHMLLHTPPWANFQCGYMHIKTWILITLRPIISHVMLTL